MVCGQIGLTITKDTACGHHTVIVMTVDIYVILGVINMFTKSICASVLLTAIMLPAAHAKNVRVTIPAGKTSAIGHFYIFDRSSCHGATYPTASFIKVKNGKLSARKKTLTIPAGKKCAGKKVFATLVYFTPDPGFRGRTKAKYGFRYPAFVNESSTKKFYSVNATINVK